jgi:hypothetical protein
LQPGVKGSCLIRPSYKEGGLIKMSRSYNFD